MNTLKTLVKSVPGVSKIIRALRNRYEPCGGFYTLSPDVLIALTKAFKVQSNGQNLFDGYGYYEFGMFRGFSFWFAEQISREYTRTDFGLFGFDSFEGLPRPQLEVEAAAFKEGYFRAPYEDVIAHLKNYGADFSRIKLYRGYFSNELFSKLRQSETFPPICICLIDVDLYNSCVPVLEFIRHLLVVGSIILFDDYNQFGVDNSAGERRALIEFEQVNIGFQKEHLFNYGWHGAAFRVIAL